ncbi:MAG: hypothetical protein JSR77_17190 [Planctomycetes bacterium]|nr:hypothetical protein [Planctomycetota bacterium]
MGLDFAIDALYETGWNCSATDRAERHVDGRQYPTPQSVAATFAEQGYDLTLRHIQLFDCYRAEWRDSQGHAAGAVVGQTAAEAAVYALSQLRRQLVAANA